jgi:recombination protein RecA
MYRRSKDIELKELDVKEISPIKFIKGDIKKNTDQKKALEAALAQIEKAFGKGAIMRLGQKSELSQSDVISTGSLSLDSILGIGGLPKGRIIEIYGPESCGKTTVTLHVIAEAQKQGGVCAFIDAEHALDGKYARHLGVNLNDLIISQPDTGEQALEIVDTLVKSNSLDVIVIDSVAALVPRIELEGEMGDIHVGLQARLMSQALRKITGSVSKCNCMIIFINQTRSKIGNQYGVPETTTGGNALKFYSSIRIDIRRIGAIKGKEDAVIGNQTRIKIVKNKLNPPFKEVIVEILYGKGISKEGELIDIGLKLGLIEKAGSWYSYKNQRLGQGRDNTRSFLSTHPDVFLEIKNLIKEDKRFLSDLDDLDSEIPDNQIETLGGETQSLSDQEIKDKKIIKGEGDAS